MKPKFKTLIIQFLKEGNRVNFREVTEIVIVSESHSEVKSDCLKEFLIPSEYKLALSYMEDIAKKFEMFEFYKYDEEYEVIHEEIGGMNDNIIQMYKKLFDRKDLIKEIK